MFVREASDKEGTAIFSLCKVHIAYVKEAKGFFETDCNVTTESLFKKVRPFQL